MMTGKKKLITFKIFVNNRCFVIRKKNHPIEIASWLEKSIVCERPRDHEHIGLRYYISDLMWVNNIIINACSKTYLWR